MLFIYLYKAIFICFFGFELYNDVYLEHIQRCKNITIKELGDFIFENYYRQIEFA